MSSVVTNIFNTELVKKDEILNQFLNKIEKENLDLTELKNLSTEVGMKENLIDKINYHYYPDYKEDLIKLINEDKNVLIDSFKEADVKSKLTGFKTGVDLTLLLLGKPQKYNSFKFIDE